MKILDVTPDDRSAAYGHAPAHYLSPDRRDPVKRLWEEPVNHRVIAAAVDALPASSRPLRVLDVGAGTGDGLALLEGGLALSSDPGRPIHYVGLDPDPVMIETARAAHADRPDVEFVLGDVRDDLPVDDVDLHLSAGVPWSHLRHAEFRGALTGVLAAAARRRGPTAVVVDVLGRYSIEWTTRWALDAWDYRMSFFHGAGEGDDAVAMPMSVHSRRTVAAALEAAAHETGTVLRSVTFHDRSVMVGRHTTTGAFTPDLPEYRSLVNRLHDGDVTLDLDRLRFTAPTVDAPAEIADFFATLEPAWNARVAAAAAHEAAAGPAAAVRTGLAAGLREVEHRLQRGLGAAHSLIGVAIVAPRGGGPTDGAG
ncbi:class I SAM-dependent methyltransferase [Actinomycetospora endophytica]|uniref:Class I SAM-dependent methyltransferase n=1 Tax=Actinomycetospora endophytica TaxID=2291215 RepID=A0ABS8PEN9_9PSEU|nr:class I SAM-dependent methyltransferase [Actinomycetospora endophytica]MCD2196724.1 class I SAM-dependent methyltransferase [Actinomycetospora endophytica]